MKICVFNGSPRGEYSTTIHTILFLQKKFKEHEFDILNIGQKIKYYEKHFDEVINAVNDAELILFSYPVYTFIAPSQVHRLIELLKESNLNLTNKFVTQITTSKHFYDITAHKYIEDNCFDLGLKVIKGLSADMEDLLEEKGQKDAIEFFKFVEHCVNNNIYELPLVNLKNNGQTSYFSSFENVEKTNKFDVVIVADLKEDDDSLKEMIKDFQAKLPYNSRIVNINEYPFQGGCLGCFNCAASGKCIYKDNFDSFLREQIQTSSATIYAFTIKDHSMGVKFKTYDDRQFCNGHRTVTEGMPVGYLVNGNYEEETNLQTILEARSEVGQNFLAGVGTSKESIESMINKLVYSLENKYVKPRTFYGVGGMKIFRDLIWLMRGIMHEDHKFYKKHGIYDFPQKKRGRMMLMCLLGSLIRNPKIKAKMGNAFNEGMVSPYKKLLEKIDKE